MFVNEENKALACAREKQVPLLTFDASHLQLVKTDPDGLKVFGDKSSFQLMQAARRLDDAGVLVYLFKVTEAVNTDGELWKQIFEALQTFD